MKKILIFLNLILVVLFIFLNCAPYKMKAIRAKRDHRYDLAIKYSVRHLKSHPGDQATIKILDSAAKGYFAALKKQIQHFENLDNWDKVVNVAENGFRTLSEVSKVVGTGFPSKEDLKYLQLKSEQSKFNQANELYTQALKFYKVGDYLEALEKFEEIESYVSHFKDSDRLMSETKGKLAEQSYKQATEMVNQGKLESALTEFEKAAQYVPGFLDVQFQSEQLKSQLAEKAYSEGQNYFDSGNYKMAYEELKKSLNYKPDHLPAKNLFNEVNDKLTVRLAVLPFSSSKLDETFSGIVSQQIITHALPKKSEFIMFLEREHLQKIFEEQALSQTGAIDEKTAIQVGKLSGVNTIVVGSVTLISDQRTGPTKRMLTAHYDRNYRDAKGVQRVKREPFNYIEYETKRTVEVNVSYRLINVETGSIMFNNSITEQASDAAKWVTCPKEFVNYLPSSAKTMMKASKEPKSKESLINQAINSLTQRTASEIIHQVSPFKEN